VLVKEAALVQGRDGVELLQKVLFTHLQRKTLTIPGCGEKRWVFVSSESSSVFPLTDVQYQELAQQCRERQTTAAAEGAPAGDLTTGPDGTRDVAGRRAAANAVLQAAAAPGRAHATLLYAGAVLEDIGYGLFAAEWKGTNAGQAARNDSEGEWADSDGGAGDEWEERVTPAVLVVAPHLQALVPTARLCEGARLQIANAHVVDLPASLQAITLGGYRYTKVRARRNGAGAVLTLS
jgi:hypothetical protein